LNSTDIKLIKNLREKQIQELVTNTLHCKLLPFCPYSKQCHLSCLCWLGNGLWSQEKMWN